MIENKKILLFDLDDTLYDFGKGETFAISYIFNLYGVNANIDNIGEYKEINKKYWEKLERKEMTKQEILEGRFEEFFANHNVGVEAKLVNKQFLDYLSHEAYYIDDCLEVLKYLKNKGYKIYIISNGIEYVQKGRLNTRSELLEYVDKLYLSDCIGYTKPDPGFVDYIINETNENKKDMIIIGDSLTSDMRLGINTGIETIWFNKNKKDVNVVCKDDKKPDYVIEKLVDLYELL